MWTGEEILEAAAKNTNGVKGDDDREDAQQEFALGVLQGQSRLDGREEGSKAFVWAYALGSVKKFLNENSNRQQHIKRLSSEDTNILENIAGDDSANPADHSELAKAVQNAINTLPEIERESILGTFFRDQTLEEVGNSLNVTKAAIHQARIRALESLKTKLKEFAI